MAVQACRSVAHRREGCAHATSALERTLRRGSVPVYVSRKRDASTHVPHNVDAFEFRDVPEVGSTLRTLLPALERVRQERAAKE